MRYVIEKTDESGFVLSVYFGDQKVNSTKANTPDDLIRLLSMLEGSKVIYAVEEPSS